MGRKSPAHLRRKLMLNNRYIALVLLALISNLAWSKTMLGIHGPERIGVVPNRPFLFLIPATGDSTLRYSVQNLPAGLNLDEKTGIIKGATSAVGEFTLQLTVSDQSGAMTKSVKLVVGEKAVALTPIMGWNPWYVWGCTVSDQKIRDAADLMVSSGMAAHGYNYINLDDCWQDKRNADGEMVPNSRFPDMKALADYVHAKGLRIGMYTGPGKTTCGGYQATEDLDFDKGISFLEKDVQMYARWGFDFIKYDWCIFPTDQREADYYKTKQQTLYQRMSDAIAASARSMVHMICQYGEKEVWKWGASVGGNMWRTNNDLADTWPAVIRNGFENIAISSFAGPGHWNDLDMLMIGKANWPMRLGDYDIPGTNPRPSQLSYYEKETHMTLWSMLASPLLFSGDLTQLDQETLGFLNNDDMIAVNQDALGAPVKMVFDSGDKKVITRTLADGTLAVAMFNLNSINSTLIFTNKMIGLADDAKYSAKNVWSREVIEATGEMKAIVPAHGTFFVILTLK
jgi:alpha-galactosidase